MVWQEEERKEGPQSSEMKSEIVAVTADLKEMSLFWRTVNS